MPDWTPSQKNAIEAKNSNILVCAAAGSGKTAVLVERVIRIITDSLNPVDIDKLLIVTFTKAAASEMKNKILNALNEVIRINPNNTNALRQLSLLPNAQICTIDSFCGNLVRENFFKLDILQDFKILDNTEKELIEKLACDDIINDLYEENQEEFKQLVELLSSSKNDDNLANAIKLITSYMMVQPFPNLWLDGIAELYNPEILFEDSIASHYFYDQIQYAIAECNELLASSFDNLDESDGKYSRFIDMLHYDKSIIDNVTRLIESSFSETKDYLDSLGRWPAIPSKSNTIIASNRDNFKDIVGYIKSYVSVTEDDYAEDCKKLYPIIKMLIQVVKNYNDKMNEYKRERNAYTFADIEHFAIQLLFSIDDKGVVQRTGLAREYESNFAEILVDEYQDTNKSQDMLFEMLSNGKNRFMVGDIKQSIYRFRLAMPQIFSNKKDNFDSYDKNSSSTNQKIILDKNFRSRKGICDYTNFIFSILMNKKIGELEYNTDEFLNSGREYPPTNIPSAQVKILQKKKDKPEAEAHQIAKLILGKINAKEQIDGRNVHFSDFAILFRNSKHIKTYTDVLTQYSIPVVANNQDNLFENNEVAILISLLRVIDNPMQDVPLLATLMSAFYGYSPDDIATAKVENKGSNLYASISKCDIFSRFIQDMDKYRKYASSMSVSTFLNQLISDTSYLALISSMGNAEQRRLNVLKFVSIAQKYDGGENVGLTSFVRYVDRIIETKSNVESADLIHTSSDSVVITTIHKSKGLEYPICIFADTSHKYNKTDLSNNVLLDADVGIGLKVHDGENLCRYNSLQYEYIKDKNTCANMSEILRVLYVAVTRAKEQFISFVTVDNIESKVIGLAKRIHNKQISPIYTKHTVEDASFILWTALLHKDGNELRKLAGIENDFIVSDFDLSVDFLDEFQPDELINEFSVEHSDELVNMIEEKLSFNYHRKSISGYASKRTASSLDEEEQGYEFFTKSKPAFLNESGMTAAEKGSAMHAFMQYCNYQQSKNNIDSEITRLVDNGFITQAQADCLDKIKLDTLFKSSFADRLFGSDTIYREIKVSTFVPVCELEDTEYRDNVLVQGIADCVFIENGEAVVVDYKTDKVETKEELLNRYKNQILFYKKAIEKTLGIPVKETLLYSFYLDDICQYK